MKMPDTFLAAAVAAHDNRRALDTANVALESGWVTTHANLPYAGERVPFGRRTGAGAPSPHGVAEVIGGGLAAWRVLPLIFFGA